MGDFALASYPVLSPLRRSQCDQEMRTVISCTVSLVHEEQKCRNKCITTYMCITTCLPKTYGSLNTYNVCMYLAEQASHLECVVHTSLLACLPTHLFAFLPTCLPSYLSAFLPVCLPTYLSASLPTCLPPYLPSSLPASLPTCLPPYLFVSFRSYSCACHGNWF